MQFFTIVVDENGEVGATANGNLATVMDVDIMATALRTYRHQRVLEERALSIPALLRKCKWVFPKDNNPRTLWGIKNCVYFVRFDNRPNEIKIGSTKSLNSRLGGHTRDQGNRPDVLGVVKSPEWHTLEMAFHAKFYQWATADTKRPEWFRREPVEAYLASVRND